MRSSDCEESSRCRDSDDEPPGTMYQGTLVVSRAVRPRRNGNGKPNGLTHPNGNGRPSPEVLSHDPLYPPLDPFPRRFRSDPRTRAFRRRVLDRRAHV